MELKEWKNYLDWSKEMAKCKLCGKEVDKNTAFKLSIGTYCCSEEELNRHNELANLVKIGRETLFSLFNSKLTTGNIIFLNSAIKEIITRHNEERFMLLADKCKLELKDNRLFNELDQSNKVKYLVAVMNNKIESQGSAAWSPYLSQLLEPLDRQRNRVPIAPPHRVKNIAT